MELALRPIALLLRPIAEFLRFIGELAYLIFDTLAATPRALLNKQGRRLGWQNLFAQMDRVGVRSIPIVCLVLFCIGAILALQTAPILRTFGMVTEVADLISVAINRELGPLVSAIVLTGFAGASIAAEMGTMVVSEEIEALTSEAINPIRFLVVPRLIATTIMMICIAVVGDIAGVVGGMVIARFFLHISTGQYLQHTFTILKLRDFLTGLIKAGVFGTLISALACQLGLSVSGGALGVGVATTRTVVLTIVALIAVDLIFTAIFYYVGW
jgi:phospholipid/cholesterol/gamma-HCH transport system permease protein